MLEDNAMIIVTVIIMVIVEQTNTVIAILVSLAGIVHRKQISQIHHQNIYLIMQEVNVTMIATVMVMVNVEPTNTVIAILVGLEIIV